MFSISGLGGAFKHNHEIYLFKECQDKPLGPYKSKIDGNTIFVEDITIPFEKGDLIRCTRKNGIVDEYEIIDPQCYDSGMLNHFKLNVRRIDAKNKPTQSQSTTNHFEIHANGNSRVSINSTDNSVNMYSFQSLQTEITKVRKAILASQEPEKEKAIESLDEVSRMSESGTLRKCSKIIIQPTPVHFRNNLHVL